MRGRTSRNDYDSTLACEGNRDGAADALAGAGDDGDFASESGAHVNILGA
jgi:hypothetical protein